MIRLPITGMISTANPTLLSTISAGWTDTRPNQEVGGERDQLEQQPSTKCAAGADDHGRGGQDQHAPVRTVIGKLAAWRYRRCRDGHGIFRLGTPAPLYRIAI